MLSNQIECILNLFDIFGYNSGSSQLSRNQKTACFIYIMHILLAIFYTIYAIQSMIMVPGIRMIVLINAAFVYISAVSAYWFIVFDSIFHKRENQLFWIFLKRNNEFLTDLNTMCFKLKLAVYICTTISCVLLYILTSDVSIGLTMFLHSILIKICEIRVFYYLFCLDVLYHQLKIIVQKLEMIKTKINFCIDSNEFKWIRLHYNCVYQMANLLNDVFGLSQVTGISYCFYITLTNINYLLVSYNDIPPLNALGKSKIEYFFSRIFPKYFYRIFYLGVLFWVANYPILIIYVSQSVTRCYVMVISN